MRIDKYIVYTESVPDEHVYMMVNSDYVDTSNSLYKYIANNQIIERYLYNTPIPVKENQKVKIKVTLIPIGKSDPIILIHEFSSTLEII